MTTTTVINNLTVGDVRRPTRQIVYEVRNAPGAGAASCELELRCWGAELERGFFLRVCAEFARGVFSPDAHLVSHLFRLREVDLKSFKESRRSWGEGGE